MKTILFLLVLGITFTAPVKANSVAGDDELKRVALSALEDQIHQHFHFATDKGMQSETVVFVELKILEGGEVELVRMNAEDEKTRALIVKCVDEMRVDDSLVADDATYAFRVRYYQR